MRKKILFIIGSPNQASQMYQVAQELPEHDAFFSQFFPDHWYEHVVTRLGLLENTIMSGEIKRKGEKFVTDRGLRYDYMGKQLGNTYDMVVLCTDLLVPRIARQTKSVWVQEGMTDPMTSWSRVVHKLGGHGYFGFNTSLNGSSNLVDIYCAASEGYKKHFEEMGTESERIFVTGIPNYDNTQALHFNHFPHHDYVMVASSDIRELGGTDDRKKFIEKCVRVADGRKLLFKPHPNEKKDRFIAEVKQYAPSNSLIYTEGNTDEMIANCAELITQWSTVVYLGLQLGKPVHSYFDVEELKKRCPIQNEGTSAKRIADICRGYLNFKGTGKEFLSQYHLDESRYRHTSTQRVEQIAG